MKKSTLIVLLIVSLVALLAVGGTLAWFTATAEPVTNTFTAGTVEISIIDEYGEVKNWNPGDTAEKEVSVKNEGTKDAYVRVKLTPAWGAPGENGFAPDSGLEISNVTLNWNKEDWMLHRDYYYYKKVLPAGETTELLLKSVKLEGADTGNKYQGKVFRIDVEADAVQASNNAYQDVWNMDNLPWEENGEAT